MVHQENIEKYDGTLESLAEDIGNLRYDALAEFLHLLSRKIQKDAIADAGRRRHHLSAHLRSCSGELATAAEEIEAAWTICAPHMNVSQTHTG